MNNTLSHFFGGSPLRVLVQLIVLSVIVGAILSVLGVSPYDIFGGLQRLWWRIYDAGFDTFRWLWDYFVIGVVVVVPLWLIMRLLRVRRTPQV